MASWTNCSGLMEMVSVVERDRAAPGKSSNSGSNRSENRIPACRNSRPGSQAAHGRRVFSQWDQAVGLRHSPKGHAAAPPHWIGCGKYRIFRAGSNNDARRRSSVLFYRGVVHKVPPDVSNPLVLKSQALRLLL